MRYTSVVEMGSCLGRRSGQLSTVHQGPRACPDPPDCGGSCRAACGSSCEAGEDSFFSRSSSDDPVRAKSHSRMFPKFPVLTHRGNRAATMARATLTTRQQQRDASCTDGESESEFARFLQFCGVTCGTKRGNVHPASWRRYNTVRDNLLSFNSFICGAW